MVACKAANAMAGAVLRPTGSNNIPPWCMSFCLSCSATKKRWASLQIKMGLAASVPFNRVMVSCSMVLSDVNDKNCLGSAARDFGQRRLPVPPASTTGFIKVLGFSSSLCGRYLHTLWVSILRTLAD